MKTAAERYAARVDAVLAQRMRLRGLPPQLDLFAGLPGDHPLLKTDPRRQLEANLEIIASYIEPDDVIVDVGGGAGRISLPLALRCRQVICVDPSAAMGAGFTANAERAGITNIRFIQGDWLAVDPPEGTVALVNHVTYFAREIVPFIENLERAGRRRAIITVTSPPPPARNQAIFQLLHGEPEEIVPGHVELANVLWELGILPDIRVLPSASAMMAAPSPTHEAAIRDAIARHSGDQWAHWPLPPDLEDLLRTRLEPRFDELFAKGADGYAPRWLAPVREILITWRPVSDRHVQQFAIIPQ